MKPDWKDAPEWARYLAMDSDGSWGFYENEPETCDHEWSCCGGRVKLYYTDINWRETLEQRPS